MLGIQPGPAMMLTGMDIVWTLIWGLMLANVLAVAIFVVLAPGLGWLSYVRGNLLIPFILTLTFLGSFLAHMAWENMVLLVVLGVFGYFLKKYDWPRPPFVIGLILGPVAEDSFHKAMALWGPSFLLRPGALIMCVLIVGSIAAYTWRTMKRSRLEEQTNAA
jgi:TctA family transporter